MDMEATWRVEWVVADGLTGCLADNRCQAGFKWLLAQVEQVNAIKQQHQLQHHPRQHHKHHQQHNYNYNYNYDCNYKQQLPSHAGNVDVDPALKALKIVKERAATDAQWHQTETSSLISHRSSSSSSGSSNCNNSSSSSSSSSSSDSKRKRDSDLNDDDQADHDDRDDDGDGDGYGYEQVD
ncbi:hypothetical protein AWZ03_006036 [Drosophila navojoa]|uniref:Uncharacterized protein n=1 Tax=Drosophila navojoa TaxID=7232 RepID=A0A484BFG2_DRONA|nr:hypothetical protein AWZ03_006036 [Drosophila navojoa]